MDYEGEYPFKVTASDAMAGMPDIDSHLFSLMVYVSPALTLRNRDLEKAIDSFGLTGKVGAMLYIREKTRSYTGTEVAVMEYANRHNVPARFLHESLTVAGVSSPEARHRGVRRCDAVMLVLNKDSPFLIETMDLIVRAKAKGKPVFVYRTDRPRAGFSHAIHVIVSECKKKLSKGA